MDTQEIMESVMEKKNGRKPWIKLILISVAVVFLLTSICLCTYPFLLINMQIVYSNPMENTDSLRELVRSNFVLYKNLYEKENGKSVSYGDLYLNEEETLILNGEQQFPNMMSETAGDENYWESVVSELEWGINQYFDEYFCDFFSQIEQQYDYYVEDTETGISMTNTELPMKENLHLYGFLVEIIYDESGNASVVTAKGHQTDEIFRTMTSLLRDKDATLPEWLRDTGFDAWNQHDAALDYPVNCRMIYGIKTSSYGQMSYQYVDYDYSGMPWMYLVLFAATILLAVFLPLGKRTGLTFSGERAFHIPAELALFAGIILFVVLVSDPSGIVVNLMTVQGATHLSQYLGISVDAATALLWLRHWCFLFVVYGILWYMGLCVRSIRILGVREYIRQRSFIYKIFPFTKKKALEAYDALEHFDLTRNAKKTILKIVLINALILFVISSLWFGGFMITVVYSALLYILLKIYISRLQKKYSILLSKFNEISSGNLNVAIPEDLGVFEPFKLHLLRIQEGFRNAVEEEVKSQRMKAELITNVSHDLKTPLTAIITYVDLLKDENITAEQRKEYLDTLERKSLRLKVLIEDLFEVSKASSGNVTMNPMDVDICNLIRQVYFELEDKLKASGLEVKMNLPEEKIICYLDSQKTYRVYENLINNIAKYSLPGTRVYVNCMNQGANVLVELKNISATELTVNPEELTERFVRGDASRNTEGSGLGLAIAKSFVELQGGDMRIQIDGDLFKVVTVFPVKQA